MTSPARAPHPPVPVALAVATPGVGARLPSYAGALAAVYRSGVARARVARASLLFAATLQSIGILLLLRGVVDDDSAVTKQQVVAGATVLVVAYVAVNLLAQRLGALKASGALDYYGALPVPASAVILGTAGSFATIAVPGAVLAAVAGALLYGLPLVHLWVLAPVLVLAGLGLAGVGALAGLLPARVETATVLGQLGMSAVLFLGLIPRQRLPAVFEPLRALVPSTYAVDALAGSLRADPDWAAVVLDLLVCAGVAAVALPLAALALRRAVTR